MGAVSVKEIREFEAIAMDAGVSEAELMERAGCALGRAIGIQFPRVGTAVAYIGKGHNGGDALIALRVLQEEFGWEVGVRAAFERSEWAELTGSQWEALRLEAVLETGFEKQAFGPLLLIDGLLGIGAKGAPREPIAGLVAEMECLRQRLGATVAAVDLPSGVDPDTGEVFAGAVHADFTFMVGAAKIGLLKARAVNAVGALACVPVEGLEAEEESELELICPQSMDFGKAPRPFEFHKGKAGRVGLIAGSEQFSGAALISTLGAIRAGGGLVTLYARDSSCSALRARLPLEAMLKSCDDPREILQEKLDAVVVGPGLGEMSDDFEEGLLELVAESELPMVIDADGLNLLARHGSSTHERHVLTPHPGEFGRLAPNLADFEREDAARQFVKKDASVLLLKGARTIVASRDKKALRINSTGHPAMSNGGQGDLLSGVIGALLAGGLEPFDAASLGAWLCGRAAELAVLEGGEICTATDTAKVLPSAIRDWKQSSR